jgi:predicted N-formylglutamate amidohydrolase
MLRELRERTGFEIGDNEPYSGRLKGNSIYTHGTVRGLPNVLLEIRQDLIREPEGQLVWATLIADCLKAILADPDSAAALSRVEHFRFHDDTASGERHSL